MIKWKNWVLGICLTGIAGMSQADSLDQQRLRYQQIKQAWDNNQMDTVEQMLPSLKDYPLYPYLEYRLISQDLDQETPLAVTNFINQYPTLPSSYTLKGRFINELARRQDWQGIISFSPNPPGPVQARCNWYYANWATGKQAVAWEGAKKLWMTGADLPSSCDALFTAWQSSTTFSPQSVLLRIELAFNDGNDALVRKLIAMLPADYGTLAGALSALQKDPQGLSLFAGSVSPTDFSREITRIAFARLARQDADNARAMIPVLASEQKMSDAEVQHLKEDVAWQYMGTDITSDQLRWRDNVVMDSDSTALIERRVRQAISDDDHRGLNTWIARLPVEAKQKDEWQYWQAELLLEQGHKPEAQQILRDLMQKRGFYPMVAAQKLGVPYHLTIDPAPAPTAAITQGDEIARVRELMYWGMDNLARSEWANLIRSKSRTEQQMLARYADEQDWWDLSVQATITAKMWDSLKERFPLAWQQYYQQYAAGKAIPVSYAMAISRQESAWNPKIRSPVGASGLMQVMPGTAAHTVKMFPGSNYVNSSQLLDPQMNIQIGMQYLDYVYRQFDQNRIFASAAYNAGPGRVRKWLTVSGGKLDAVGFIETIPFAETRNYVKNVLAYDAYYRYFLGQPDQIIQDAEWNRRY
ncbi:MULTISPECIES: murein transglycosylase [Tatumella]|uniref:murein transglycosylase n=1 Tax=Tatumella TaxID=82986 RepID=UPI0004720DD5|nr:MULTISPECIES: murein transglycosylase [Tatumella]